MAGALPPSSRFTFVIFAAAAAIIADPLSTLPVQLIILLGRLANPRRDGPQRLRTLDRRSLRPLLLRGRRGGNRRLYIRGRAVRHGTDRLAVRGIGHRNARAPGGRRESAIDEIVVVDHVL